MGKLANKTTIDNVSKRASDWLNFSAEVFEHIETYTVPQYGDKGEDSVTTYSAEDCIKQAQKYMSRFGRNARPGQEQLDLLKAAHYVQLAASKMKGETE